MSRFDCADKNGDSLERTFCETSNIVLHSCAENLDRTCYTHLILAILALGDVLLHSGLDKQIERVKGASI